MRIKWPCLLLAWVGGASLSPLVLEGCRGLDWIGADCSPCHRSRQLFSSTLTPSSASTASGVRDSNTYQQFRVVDERIAEGVRETMAELQEESAGGEFWLGEGEERVRPRADD